MTGHLIVVVQRNTVHLTGTLYPNKTSMCVDQEWEREPTKDEVRQYVDCFQPAMQYLLSRLRLGDAAVLN